MKNHPKNERTLVVVKPDGVQRTLVGEIISRYERMGLKLVGLKIALPSKEHVEKHYTLEPTWKESVGKKTIESYKKQGKTPPSDDPVKIGDTVLGNLINYMTSGPVIAMVWEGAHAVEVVRKVTGGTEPRTSDVGTIRGDYVLDSYQMADSDGRSVRNLIHASGTVEEANNEIALWFDKSEVIDYRLVQEEILYDVNLDGILE
jgi:nucleoside-diphosphate kinase